MPTNENILKKFQAGTEVTRGTGVAATRKMYSDFSPTYDRAIQDYPDRSGTFFRRRRVAYQRPVYGMSGTELLTFEDFPLWLRLLLRGGVTGVLTNTTVYTYTFLPTPATDDLDSWTVEFGEPGNVYKSTQFMLTSGQITIDPENNGAWMLDWDGVMRDWTSSAYTGSIADRTTEAIRAAGTKCYIDTATIGSTQVQGTVISAQITISNNLHLKPFIEDDQTWSANKVGRDARLVDAVITIEFANDTEFANYRSLTEVQRKVRLSRDGSNIAGASPTTPKNASLDLYGYWSSIGFGDRDGNMTATFGLAGFYDTTATTDLSAVVKNGISALP